MISRRKFVNGLAAGAAGSAFASTAKSYAQILGANDRLNFAINGLNGRGHAHLSSLRANSKNARVAYICDVDSASLRKFAAEAEQKLGYAPKAEADFRHALESKEVDAITIATPDHWHTPMAVLGLKAGKHVYVEKPSSQNPREGELLVAAQKKYGKLVQVGDQQRSSDYTIRMIQKIHDGYIGEAYMAKAWYANTRGAMGIGKPAPVPASLNWDLWQGPAPRSEYKDNIHPYNWHWLRRYGTGETLNNGTHEVDVCRWALQAEIPHAVTASGGRYKFKDDWQFHDTIITNFEYPGKLISWEGRTCQGMRLYDRDRGSVIIGHQGLGRHRPRRLRRLRLEGQADRHLPHRPRHFNQRPDRRRYHDRRSLRQLHRGHSRPGEAQLARSGRQRHRHHAAALEHRLVRRSIAAPRHPEPRTSSTIPRP